MTRRERIELIDVEPSRLAAAMDEAIDRIETRKAEMREAPALIHQAAEECADEFMRDGVMRPLAAYALGAAPLPAKRDPRVRWANELVALRAWFYAEDKGQLGDTGRALARIELGATIQGSPKVSEPIPDHGIEVVARVIAALPPYDRAVLVAAYVELSPPRATTKRGETRDDDGFGFGGAPSASAMSIAATARETGAQTTWVQLVAERFGISLDEAEMHKMREAAKRARRILRSALAAVELDGRVRWLIPAKALPTRKQMDRDSADHGSMIDGCAGAPVVDGVRLACEVMPRPAEDCAASPRCERCGRPK